MKYAVGHGEVRAYCSEHGIEIAEEYTGDILRYAGGMSLIVTDAAGMSMFEYYYIKYRLLCRGIELRSPIDYGTTGKVLDDFVMYMVRRGIWRTTGRQPYGFRLSKGQRVPVAEEMAKVREVLARRDRGESYRRIAQAVGLPHSSIQVIVKNRRLYENGGEPENGDR